MIAKFDLQIPQTLQEACELKKEYGEKAHLAAGGTDVYAKLHDGKHHYDYIIDLKQVPGLDGITFSPEKGMDIGALVTHHEIETNPDVLAYYPVLADGVKTIGSLQVRNRGTIGGNIGTAAPSADAVGPLLVLDAVCVVEGLSGSRTVPLKEFFTGPKRTVLGEDEILTRIQLPPVPKKYGAAYFKYGRRNAMEIALQTITAYVETEDDGKTCSTVRIALGTSAPTPIRATKTEEYYLGKDLSDPEVIKKGGEVVLEEAKPRSSWRSSAEFRRDLLIRLVPRTVKNAYVRLQAKK
ncbi:MAG: FAD binding domain-containing protein [Spirochaetota bacterium]